MIAIPKSIYLRLAVKKIQAANLLKKRPFLQWVVYLLLAECILLLQSEIIFSLSMSLNTILLINIEAATGIAKLLTELATAFSFFIGGILTVTEIIKNIRASKQKTRTKRKRKNLIFSI